LVALKAFFIALTALAMLRTARTTGPSWVSAGSVVLALLAMSPRFASTACLSLALLALVVLDRAGGRAYGAIPLVIALWANLDEWYFLGPLLVGLAAIGPMAVAAPAKSAGYPAGSSPVSLARVCCSLPPKWLDLAAPNCPRLSGERLL